MISYYRKTVWPLGDQQSKDMFMYGKQPKISPVTKLHILYKCESSYAYVKYKTEPAVVLNYIYIFVFIFASMNRLFWRNFRWL